MMLDATQNYSKTLTNERLFGWHAALFPTGFSGMSRIKVAAWRDDIKGPMQVISGPVGHEHVHYEALAAALVGTEKILEAVFTKARFWEKFATIPLNERQLLMLNKLIDGFEGNLTSSKWARIAKCSQDTALRDIREFLDRGILVKAALFRLP
jgi:Fic family protein